LLEKDWPGIPVMLIRSNLGERRCVEALRSDWLLYCRFSDGS